MRGQAHIKARRMIAVYKSVTGDLISMTGPSMS